MSENDQVKAIKKQRTSYLAFATVALLFVGLIYAWSIFATPIGREYPDYAPLLGQVFQVIMFVFCTATVVGSQVIKWTSTQFAIRIGSIVMAIGYVTSALFAGLGAWALVLFYGGLVALGSGIALIAILTLVNDWFPDRIGFSTGMQMMGIGLSALIFGSIADVLFGIIGWKWVLALIACATVIILMALSFFVKTAPEDIASTLQVKTTGLQPPAAEQQATKAGRQAQSENILASKTFWLYCIWAIVIIASGLAFVGSARQGVESIDPGFAYGALFVGITSTMNGVGRLIYGALFDRFGLVPIMALGAVFTISSLVGLVLAVLTNNLILFLISGVLIAFSYASTPVLASAFARERFGAKDYAKNLGITNLNVAAAALLNMLLFALLGPVGDGMQDELVYGALALLALGALVTLLLFNRSYKADIAKLNSKIEG